VGAGEDDNELAALRARAYGPGGDIQGDPRALQRLLELESAGRQRYIPPENDEGPRDDSSPSADGPAPGPVVPAQDSLTRRLARRVAGLPRSTVLIALAVAAFVVLILVVTTLVQRIRVDPLQVGAEEIARLSIDPTYEVPLLFGQGMQDEAAVEPFQQFHGIRTLVAPGGFFSAGGHADCLTLYSDVDIVDLESSEFNGPILGGCSAGAFPATVQFNSDITGFSDELVEEFPETTALQFVYDSANNEVVVFTAVGGQP